MKDSHCSILTFPLIYLFARQTVSMVKNELWHNAPFTASHSHQVILAEHQSPEIFMSHTSQFYHHLNVSEKSHLNGEVFRVGLDEQSLLNVDKTFNQSQTLFVLSYCWFPRGWSCIFLLWHMRVFLLNVLPDSFNLLRNSVNADIWPVKSFLLSWDW